MCITLFHIHYESILAEKYIHVCFCIWQILVLWQLEKIILSCIYPLKKKIKNLEFSLTSELFIYLSNQYHICITCIFTITECWMLKIPFVKSSQIINEWFIGLNREKTPPLKKSKMSKDSMIHSFVILAVFNQPSLFHTSKYPVAIPSVYIEMFKSIWHRSKCIFHSFKWFMFYDFRCMTFFSKILHIKRKKNCTKSA